jgi:hypothetical protein
MSRYENIKINITTPDGKTHACEGVFEDDVIMTGLSTDMSPG